MQSWGSDREDLKQNAEFRIQKDDPLCHGIGPVRSPDAPARFLQTRTPSADYSSAG
jgi:hypothetical protein